MNRTLRLSIPLLLILLLSVGFTQRQAHAELRDRDGNTVGMAHFSQDDDDSPVTIRVEVRGLLELAGGERGIHLHETGACEPDFGAAGGHFNPTGAEHGLLNPDGAHAGDLPNITIDELGNADYEVTTALVTLGEGERSLFDDDGTAMIIHAEADDHVTDPTGDSGDRIVCGVVTEGAAPEGDATTGEADSATVVSAEESGDLMLEPGELAPGVVLTENDEQEQGVPYGMTGHLFRPEQRDATEELIAGLSLPEGFEISIYAQGLENPRMLAQAPDGTIYVTQREPGQVTLLRDNTGDELPDEARVVVSGLEWLHGIMIHEGNLYLVTDTELFVGAILENGDIGELQTIVDDLPDAGQHPNRTLAMGTDGYLYITLGSTCNACVETNPEAATIVRMALDGSERSVFVEGLRNTLGFGWHPETGDMWGFDMGTDWRGDNRPPEELNLIVEGNHYGWPFCYGDQNVDVYVPLEPDGMTREEFCAASTPPVLMYTAHSSPIMMVFYTAEQFPEEYRNDVFVTLRGSWNRYPASGYKVVRVRFENGQPVGIEDFITSWLIEDGYAHFGRLAGMMVAQDGSLLISEDTNGVIYRVSYTGE